MNIYITLRLYWFFFKFVNVSNILITFNDFTCCSIITIPVTLFVNFTYWVVTGWYQFVCLTLEFDFFWTVINNCVVVFTNWLSQFISYCIFNDIAFSIYIVNVNITLRLYWFFFKFVDVCNILINRSNFTCSGIITCPVTLFVYLTYWIVTSWNQFICLTLEYNFFWTVVNYCVVIFIDWLFVFISY